MQNFQNSEKLNKIVYQTRSIKMYLNISAALMESAVIGCRLIDAKSLNNHCLPLAGILASSLVRQCSIQISAKLLPIYFAHDARPCDSASPSVSKCTSAKSASAPAPPNKTASRADTAVNE
jgi:hypothetical protein